MIPFVLALRPGVDTQHSALQVKNGLVSSNLIRHRNSLIEKLGGCQRLSNILFTGLCRCLFAWQDLQGNKYLAIGTNQYLQIFANGTITPIASVAHTSNLTGAFNTTAGSPIVTATDAGFSPAVGQWFLIVNATVSGRLLLQGVYQVISTSGDTFTFNAGAPALTTSGTSYVVEFTTLSGSADVVVTLGAYSFQAGQTLTIAISTTVNGLTFLGPYSVLGGFITGPGNATGSGSGFENGGATRVEYLQLEPSEGSTTGAFGSGPFGAGPFGVGSVSTALVEWSMGNWGQNLVWCNVGTAIYQWVPPPASGNVSAAVSGAPAAVNGLFVAAPQQQLMAWGIYSAALGEQDPLLLGWCDVANLNSWTATATNQAGSFRLSSGSLIVGGTWFGVAGLIWTDIEIWQMSYIGFPLVYGFNKVAPNCGLIARRAFAILGTQVAWMSQQDFFIYQSGQVAPMLCPVRGFVFESLDTAYLANVHADANTYGNEITWWFPQKGSNGVCTGAVKWHAAGGEWDIIQSGLTVSAWTDQSVLGPPIGSFYTGLLEQFETAIDFDGVVLDSFILSGFFDLAEGQEFILLKQVFPDLVLEGTDPQVTMTFFFADDMGAATAGIVRTYGPFTVTPTTEYFWVNGRGRIVQVRLDSTSPNTFWRYGSPLATIQADGRR